MKSKANFKTHPIHPMLIPFPIAFLTGAFVFNVIGLVTAGDTYATTGGYLTIAGIAGGLLAAVPGIIDYFFTVPPDSSAKTRATKHMLVNSGALILFAASFWLRGSAYNSPTFLGLIFELIALGLLVAGGWMGGTLVYRNQIGVDHRYAGAGKWKEGKLPQYQGKKILVGKTDFLKENQMKLLHLDGKRIVIAKTEKGYVGFEDHCTHKGGSLADGSLTCGIVQCPWHGSQFDVYTGDIQEGPAKEKIKVYNIQQEGEKVFLVM